MLAALVGLLLVGAPLNTRADTLARMTRALRGAAHDRALVISLAGLVAVAGWGLHHSPPRELTPAGVARALHGAFFDQTRPITAGELQPGMVIDFRNPVFFDHRAVVFLPDAHGRPQVAHSWERYQKNRAAIHLLEDAAKGRDLLLVSRRSLLPPDQVVARAKRAVGRKQRFSLFFNNCQHFVERIATGRDFSKGTRRLVAFAPMLLLLKWGTLKLWKTGMFPPSRRRARRGRRTTPSKQRLISENTGRSM